MSDFRGKKVLVMGLGLHSGGEGTVKFLIRRGAKVTVTDLRTKKELRPILEKLMKALRQAQGRHQKVPQLRSGTINFVLGRHRKSDFLASDLIVKNPGVRPDSPYLELARKKRVPIASDMGIFFNLCPGKIIGVTGTRGKSTAAYLIWRFLKTKSGRVFLGGNIRKSALEFLDEIRENDLVVLELSSFQLSDLAPERKSPKVAVLTNVLKDHLDWHGTLKKYIEAKSVIFKFQKTEDLLFINPALFRKSGASPQNRILFKLLKKARGRIIKAPLRKNFRKVVDENLGRHYRETAGLAVAVAKHFGVKNSAVRQVLKNFKGLEGRGELIATIRGVRFVNDTTSTVPEATMAAIKRIQEIKKPKERIVLIAGGQDKNLSYKELARHITRNVSALVLLPGSATEKLKKELKKTSRQARGLLLPELAPLNSPNLTGLVEGSNMKEVVKTTYRFARRGDWVLLSPGAASFGLFLNEFDRGEQFVKYVRQSR